MKKYLNSFSYIYIIINMLSIKYLSNFLDENQVNIDEIYYKNINRI